MVAPKKTTISPLKTVEKFGFVVLVVLMMIMSGASILSARNAEEAVKNTDLIAQCTTPGTKCAELQADQRLRETAQGICPILIELPPAAEREERRDEILANYERCVTEMYERLKARPIAVVNENPTTTTRAGD
jgi:hypothetical protein